MKILSKQPKTHRSGDSYYFGEYGEVDLGLSVTRIESESTMYQDVNHYHQKSVEYYLVLEGKALFIVEDQEVEVEPMQTLMLDPGEVHRLLAVKQFPCVIVSISSKKLLHDKVIV